MIYFSWFVSLVFIYLLLIIYLSIYLFVFRETQPEMILTTAHIYSTLRLQNVVKNRTNAPPTGRDPHQQDELTQLIWGLFQLWAETCEHHVNPPPEKR